MNAEDKVRPEVEALIARAYEDAANILHAVLDVWKIPRYSDSDEMPPDVELDLDERLRRAHRVNLPYTLGVSRVIEEDR